LKERDDRIGLCRNQGLRKIAGRGRGGGLILVGGSRGKGGREDNLIEKKVSNLSLRKL